MVRKEFKTEVNQLLNLIIHSMYSHPEIFLRELISNASDALDKLKYLTLTDDKYKNIHFDPRIEISINIEKPRIVTLTEPQKDKEYIISVSDNGIGMNDTELDENLGTIAKSGTKEFLKNLTGDYKKDSNLIGEFGIGFYSAFMVADKVEVISRRAGEDKAYMWTSDGKGGYEITEAERAEQGTTVKLYLNENGRRFADRFKIEEIVKKYSNHIPFPIYLNYPDIKKEGEDPEKAKRKVEQINAGSALWRRPKNEIKEEEYNEFYKSISYDPEDPLLYIHTQAEGTIEYTTLFYIPKKAPIDLFWSDFKPGVKLYIKRVFITDDSKELMPHYLRFVRGIIDSEDLPLNVSREMLQENRILTKIRNDSVKRILNELLNLKKNDRKKYEEFYREFSKPLKEGVYQDTNNRETLVKLLLFKSTEVEGYTDFDEYLERNKDAKAIYYITGGSAEVLKESPLLEAYKKKNIEVLIMDDEVDEVVMPVIGTYKELPLKSVNRIDTSEDIKSEEDKKKEKEAKPLVERIKKVLKDEVKDVRASMRLSDSPCCIVADENDPTIQMQNLLKAIGQKDLPEIKPILEINPDHEIIKALAKIENEKEFEEITRLLLEEALLIEGVQLKNMGSFVKRLNRVLEKALVS